MRERIGEDLLRWLPGDTGAIAAGILIGGGEWLSFGVRQDLARVGLLHVVAASGYNVTVVTGWVMAVAIKTVGRKWGIILAGFGVMGYMFLAGWSASVVRAGVMGVLVLGAKALGRPATAGWLLVLTAMGMLTIRSGYLNDVGWQLSVMATAGLIWIKPQIDEKWKGWGWLAEDMRTSLATQVAVAPIILHYFGNFSAISPVVNAVVLWTIPLAMQISAIAVGFGMLWTGFGQALALLAWPFLAFFLGTASWAADLPWAAGNFGKMSWMWVGVYYLVLGIVLFRRKA